jgi:hypothetical protein
VGTFLAERVSWGDTVGSVESFTNTTTSIAVIAASIPVGFLVYQFYYRRYKPILGRYVTLDRGAEILRRLPPDVLERLRTLFDARLDVRRSHVLAKDFLGRQASALVLDEQQLKARYHDVGADRIGAFELDERNPERIYTDNWYENWSVFRSVLDFACAYGQGAELKREFTTLSDIYHALGASRVAVILGWGGGILYVATAHGHDAVDHPVKSLVALLFTAIATAVTVVALHQTRRATWASASKCAGLGLRWCFSIEEDGLLRRLPQERGYVARRSRRFGIDEPPVLITQEPPPKGASEAGATQ